MVFRRLTLSIYRRICDVARCHLGRDGLRPPIDLDPFLRRRYSDVGGTRAATTASIRTAGMASRKPTTSYGLGSIGPMVILLASPWSIGPR